MAQNPLPVGQFESVRGTEKGGFDLWQVGCQIVVTNWVGHDVLSMYVKDHSVLNRT